MKQQYFRKVKSEEGNEQKQKSMCRYDCTLTVKQFVHTSLLFYMFLAHLYVLNGPKVKINSKWQWIVQQSRFLTC